MSLSSEARTITGLVLAAFLLAACNTADDSTNVPTTGEEAAFQLRGDVSAVDIEDVDVDVDVSAGPDGVDIDPSASARVQLTINLEEINSEAAQLCGLQSGSDAVVVVTDETDLQMDRPLEELGSIQDESVTASGTARKLADAGTQPTEPAGGCALDAATLGLDEEPQGEGNPTPVA